MHLQSVLNLSTNVVIEEARVDEMSLVPYQETALIIKDNEKTLVEYDIANSFVENAEDGNNSDLLATIQSKN